MSDSLRPHELQHARPPCPSPTPGIHSNSCPSSWWCHPAISSSVIPFSPCPQSLSASGSFPVSQFFPSCGQSIKSFSFSISPASEYSGLISFRMDWLDLLAVHESWPDTNRRLWTQGFQRETLRAILHLELLLTFARSQTSMEAAAAAAAAAAKSLQSCLTAANACK